LEDGLGQHSPSVPDTDALHCSIELKLQLFMKSTSRLQYSPARTVCGASNAVIAIAPANVAAESAFVLNLSLIICIFMLST